MQRPTGCHEPSRQLWGVKMPSESHEQRHAGTEPLKEEALLIRAYEFSTHRTNVLCVSGIRCKYLCSELAIAHAQPPSLPLRTIRSGVCSSTSAPGAHLHRRCYTWMLGPSFCHTRLEDVCGRGSRAAFPGTRLGHKTHRLF